MLHKAMKKNLLLVVLALMLAGVVTGCNNSDTSNANSASTNAPAVPSTNAPASTNT
jgi:uncharacterized lipoprotein YehR (DUF1307 family)